MRASTIVFALSAFASSVAALKITVPGGDDLWWIANSQNNIFWTCKDADAPKTFTILVSNADPKVLTSPQAIVAQQDNFDCSRMLDNHVMAFAAAKDYKVLLANPLNSTEVYAESEPFEIKAQGQDYPPASATPAGADGSTVTSSSPSSSQTSAEQNSNSGALPAFSFSSSLGLAITGVVASLAL